MAGPALAFDSVTWTWDATVLSDVTTSAVSDISVVPTGLEQVEIDQSALGSFTATSSSLAVLNEPLAGLAGIELDNIPAVNTSASALGSGLR